MKIIHMLIQFGIIILNYQLMNRNSYTSHSGNQFSTHNAYKTASGPYREQISRSPLYPIGPTLTQPQFKPIQRGLSPYVSRQGMMPPSYQQKYLHQSSSNFMNNSNQLSMGKRYDQTKINYEDRQKEIIARNQAQIEEEHKRREQIRISYQRQINSKTANLTRNQEKKQKLLSEMEALQHSHDQIHQKYMSLHPPSHKLNTYQPLDRKQQQMIIMKNKLITQMREKESDLLKDQDEEEKYWEQQIGQKQRIIIKLQTQLNNKRIQLSHLKNSIEKPDFITIQDQIREERYNDFIFQSTQVDNKINRLTQQRVRLSSEVADALTMKKPQLHNIRLKHQDLSRERQEIKMRVNDLERIGKQMQQANNNLLNDLERKQDMITKYERDIQTLKDKKYDQQSSMTKLFNQARQDIQNDLIPSLTKEISTIQQELRFQWSITTKLKTQYQRMYELLCSAATKNLHQTFNTVYSN